MADMTCTHGRLEGSCEDCAFEAAEQRPDMAHVMRGLPHPKETRKVQDDLRSDTDDAAPVSRSRRRG
jgi:hypothetical protein